MAEELIVFVDAAGRPTGETGPKLASHHAETKLHLAFSCYIFRQDGKLLVTQRAHTKKVWPDVWTNSVCGHPGPGEAVMDAVNRRADFELGMQLADITEVVPDYFYRTPPYNGIIENEFCPVFVALAASELRPNPEEVEAYQWLSWRDYVQALRTEAAHYSYWAKDQRAHLEKSAELRAWCDEHLPAGALAI